MTNFDINLENIISSALQVKASGSLAEEIKKDLELPDGENIEKLLGNEKNIKK